MQSFALGVAALRCHDFAMTSSGPAEAHQKRELLRLRRLRDRIDRAYIPLVPRKYVLVWLFGMAFGLVVQWPSGGRDDLYRWLPDLIVGWTLLSCGLGARLRSRWLTGGLLLTAGLAWFLPDLAGLAPDRAASALSLTLLWHQGPLLHAVLAYPTGRATSRSVAAVIVATYAGVFLQPVWRGDGLAVATAALVLLASVVGYVAASPSRRRARMFALAAAVAWAAMIASGVLVRSTSADASVNRPVLLAYEAAICAMAVALTLGLRAVSWEQAVVTDLVVELGDAAGGDIRGQLAAALGDPQLAVGYWNAETQSYLDVAGHELQKEHSGRSLTFVERAGRPLAVLVLDPVILADPALVEGLSAATRLVAAHARLQAEVQARVAEVARSQRRILDTADEERGRLERRLQAGAVRRLDEIAELLATARTTAADQHTTALITRAQSQLVRTVEELQQLARGIHPRDLSHRGLEIALTELISDVSVPVELTVSAPDASPRARACAYFVCSEALANVTKHATATKVRICVTSGIGSLSVEVVDDGAGGADLAQGTGLQGLADRVGALGGSFVVVSPVGGGTRITASVPLR
jgi:signal transduction histidine kinase